VGALKQRIANVVYRLRAKSFAYTIGGAICVGLMAFGSSSANAQSPEYVPGEVLIKLRGKASAIQSQAFIGKSVSEKSMSLKGSWPGLNLHHFALKPGQKVEDAIAELKDDPNVEYIEPNYIIHRQSDGIEGNPVAMADVQAAAASDVTTFSQTLAPISLAQAWAAESNNASSPIVAVIDTGLDLTHDVFVNSGAIWTNAKETLNGIDDDANGYIDDIHGWNFVAGTNSPQDDDGHGTHCSGIVLGTSQDITASPIAAARVRIMPLKFLDSTGSGSTSDAIKAIYYAVNNGAKVLSNSWGGGGYSSSLVTAIAYANDNKVAFVAAAGNASSNNDSTPTYPANYVVPNMISVAATSDSDAFASFSNFGITTVNLGSPGVSIWSTYKNNGYARASGTSMATPFVAGIAALILRESPSLTGYEVKNLIYGGAQAISSLATKTSTKSRINVYNSLIAAKAATPTGSQPKYDASANREPASASSSSSGGAAGGAAGCGLVAKAFSDSDGDDQGGPFKNLIFFGVLVLLAAPIAVAMALRNREISAAEHRRHPRFQVESSVVLKLGDRQLTGQVSTISMGGVQIDTDAWLEKGGIVKMSICSPDGKEQIEVEGAVVWSSEQKSYGVQFSNADAGIRSTISSWTRGLVKAS
jgi:subtilisin family serine protease